MIAAQASTKQISVAAGAVPTSKAGLNAEQGDRQGQASGFADVVSQLIAGGRDPGQVSAGAPEADEGDRKSEEAADGAGAAPPVEAKGPGHPSARDASIAQIAAALGGNVPSPVKFTAAIESERAPNSSPPAGLKQDLPAADGHHLLVGLALANDAGAAEAEIGKFTVVARETHLAPAQLPPALSPADGRSTLEGSQDARLGTGAPVAVVDSKDAIDTIAQTLSAAPESEGDGAHRVQLPAPRPGASGAATQKENDHKLASSAPASAPDTSPAPNAAAKPVDAAALQAPPSIADMAGAPVRARTSVATAPTRPAVPEDKTGARHPTSKVFLQAGEDVDVAGRRMAVQGPDDPRTDSAPTQSGQDGRPTALPLSQLRQVAERIAAEAQSSPPEAVRAETIAPDRPPSASPVKVLSIQLKPAELGSLTIRMSLRSDALDVQITADRQETARLLQQDRDALAKLLHANGVHTDSIVVVNRSADAPPPSASTAQAHTQLSSQYQSGSGFQHSDAKPFGRQPQGHDDKNPNPGRKSKNEISDSRPGGNLYV